jgi:glycerol-3-phosphate dehydrogenase
LPIRSRIVRTWRRIRLLIESPDAGVAAAPAVAVIMGCLLGWGRRRALEVRSYAELAAASCEALQSPADLSEPAAPVSVPA